MQAKIKSLHLENFKGVKKPTDYIFDGKNSSIIGANATGKTTIADSLWWLLFNKDSAGNEKFSIRPLDSDGKQIDNVEICVSAVLDIDGEEMELKKVQKQKWVKQRSSSVATLQGNVNSYEVDGYPKSEKEYKECVAGISEEELFKILTNPFYLPSLKWNEQRSRIIVLADDIPDVEVARQNEKFAGLLPDLEKANSTDDIKKKYQKALNEWKEKQAELPVRIDEVEKQKVDIDVAELELLKNSLNEKIAENKEKQEDISKEFEEQQKASDGIIELQCELNDLQRKANEKNNSKRRGLEDSIAYQKFLAWQKESEIKYAEHRILNIKGDIQRKEILIEDMRNRYNAAQALELDENSLVCKFCGQSFPKEKQSKIKADFEQKKADEIQSVAKIGNETKSVIDKLKSALENEESGVAERKETLRHISGLIVDLEKQLSELSESIDISDRPEVQEIKSKIAEKEAAMNKGNSAEEIRQQLKDEENELRNKIYSVDCKLVSAQKNTEIDDRIAELQTEQREVAQKVADQEKMLYLLEEFIRFKMDRVSDTINQKLDGICVKLFERQINSGIRECCELTYNGVPYQSLNSGHRIVAGLKIIKALQEFYGIYAPIFVDNAESINDFNLPQMNCQMITLSVTEDKELKIMEV